MATFVPPKKNTAYTLYVGLVSQADTKLLQANPTLAAGDVKVAIDDGAPANLATLPVVDADFTKRVKVVLSAAEMNGDNITIIFSDAAGAEWCDLQMNFQTAARQIDDLAFPNVSGRGLDVSTDGDVEANLTKIDGTVNVSATLNLKKLNIVNDSGDAIVASSTGGNGTGLNASGNGTGDGIKGTGGATGNGIEAVAGATSGSGLKADGGANGYGAEFASTGFAGLRASGGGAGAGVSAIGGATGHGVEAIGGGTSGNGVQAIAQGGGHGVNASAIGANHGVNAQGGATGHGIRARGGATSGDGVKAEAQVSGHGFEAVGVGATQHGILATAGTNGDGVRGNGNGTGDGARFTGGATGQGLHTVGGATSGAGFKTEAPTSGAGIQATSIGAPAIEAAAVDGEGISATVSSDDPHQGIYAVGAAGGSGLRADGEGVGPGIDARGGVSGDGMRADGGATTGDGFKARSNGGNGHGFHGIGNGTGFGLNFLVEGVFKFVEVLRIAAATVGAKLSGAATATNTFRDLSDTKNRVTATVDAAGNRTAVSYDVT